jgi:choline dehydrogenase-like flavoprotein
MKNQKIYDFVIVGAGAAGCVLANRLTVDPNTQVLLLEAGGKSRSILVKIPAGFGKLMGTKYNWIFNTTPQKHMMNRQMFLPQGKGLGGSTAVNAMLYIRGNPGDYNAWRDAGNPGWGYEDVLPYFIKSECNERIADEFHGTSGPLNVADQIQKNRMTKAFVRAAQETGIHFTADPNGKNQEGVFFHQVTQKNAARESAATAYLNPVRNRPNLTVVTGANVTKIEFENEKAVGVRYSKGKNNSIARVNREVIVSAGAINTPRLLLLSGLGDEGDLKKLGIKVIRNIPGVGKNLHDQLEVYVTARTKDPITYTGEDRALRAVVHGIQYLLFKTGPATATVTEAGAFVKSDPTLMYPDIQLHALPVYVKWKDLARKASKAPGHGITILACFIRPQSRGEVKLVSADPRIAPAVDPNYLAEKVDTDISVKGIQLIRQVMAAPALKELLTEEDMPGSHVQSEQEIADYILQWGKTDYHPVGTCKMGNGTDAVVNSRLKVHGVRGLRVIDSSIMPSIISGNTQAPSMMIGEKGAAMILEDWEEESKC